MKKMLMAGMLVLFVLVSCGKSGEHRHACEGHDHEAETAEHETDHEGHDHESEENEPAHADEINIAPEKAQSSGIVSETVRPDVFQSVIAVSGQIQTAQSDEIVIVANAAGVVSFSRPLAEGMAVSKNAVLFSISSAHLQDGDLVEHARIAYESAKLEFERAEKLVDSQIISRKDFNAIRKNYEQTRIAYEALKPGEGGKGVAVRATVDGYIKNCQVQEGDYAAVGQPLMTIVRNRRLYLKADVPERYYPQLNKIVSANFKTSYTAAAYRLRDLNGRLLSYGRSSDDASFHIPVTFEFDNPGNIFPGSFAEIFLLSDERRDAISVPLSALTEEQGVNFIYLQLDEAHYRKQEVKTGVADGERVEILSGLKGGENVVTQGAIYVKLASASNSIPAHHH